MQEKYKIHPMSDVQTSDIGEGTVVWQYCVILNGAKIGANCNINFNVLIENDVVIGNKVTIKPGVQVWNGVTIGDNVMVGPNVTFTNDLRPRSKPLKWKLIETFVEKGASIGANSTIVAGITIGECALIGAGSVVTKDIPPYTLWYGNPARHKGYITQEGIVLTLDLVDIISGNRYKLNDSKPTII